MKSGKHRAKPTPGQLTIQGTYARAASKDKGIISTQPADSNLRNSQDDEAASEPHRREGFENSAYSPNKQWTMVEVPLAKNRIVLGNANQLDSGPATLEPASPAFSSARTARVPKSADSLDAHAATVVHEAAEKAADALSRKLKLLDLKNKSQIVSTQADVGIMQHARDQGVGSSKASSNAGTGSGSTGVKAAPSRRYKAFAFDIETTGLRTVSTRIIELAVVDVDTGKSYATLVNPGIRITKGVHGISNSQVHARDVPKVARALTDFISFIREACKEGSSKEDGQCTPVLVAHNGAVFDFQVLMNECRRSLVQLPGSWMYMDTFRAAQHLKLKQQHQLPDLKQDTLRKHYHLPQPAVLHRALHDAEALVGIYQGIMRDAGEDVRMQDLADLGKRIAGELGSLKLTGHADHQRVQALAADLMQQLPGYDLVTPQDFVKECEMGLIQLVNGEQAGKPYGCTPFWVRSGNGWSAGRPLFLKVLRTSPVEGEEAEEHEALQDGALSPLPAPQRQLQQQQRPSGAGDAAEVREHGAALQVPSVKPQPFCILLANMRVMFNQGGTYAYRDNGNKPQWSLSLAPAVPDDVTAREELSDLADKLEGLVQGLLQELREQQYWPSTAPAPVLNPVLKAHNSQQYIRVALKATAVSSRGNVSWTMETKFAKYKSGKSVQVELGQVAADRTAAGAAGSGSQAPGQATCATGVRGGKASTTSAPSSVRPSTTGMRQAFEAAAVQRRKQEGHSAAPTTGPQQQQQQQSCVEFLDAPTPWVLLMMSDEQRQMCLEQEPELAQPVAAGSQHQPAATGSQHMGHGSTQSVSGQAPARPAVPMQQQPSCGARCLDRAAYDELMEKAKAMNLDAINGLAGKNKVCDVLVWPELVYCNAQRAGIKLTALQVILH
eukprot:CAMPEP_0202891180 /NCGR_PEP_ID=MMETSP1392-20130828/1312_1 /ASSEMBLY_ACC=CAM_ASM_000868 /TAXON_ID=225041 /ORGANISM="Chlamydomonas chlamydogama, Strain SAG 11-48b" /LENGTH=894 /DNA_ID=CAMNT_0049574865 /DNA_START=163 /DNA_END=2847 /DNA_ORIENTATION=+